MWLLWSSWLLSACVDKLKRLTANQGNFSLVSSHQSDIGSRAQQISIFEACCSLMHMSITLFENGPWHLKLRPVKHQTQQSHSRSILFSTLLLSSLVIDHQHHKLYKVFIIQHGCTLCVIMNQKGAKLFEYFQVSFLESNA